jgi:CRISPR-associated protein Cmr4
MIHQIFCLRTISPTHCGVGQGLNDIDLPTARHSVSGHPVIPATSIKGVLKDEYLVNGIGPQAGSDDWKDKALALFGGEQDEDMSNTFASALSLGDACLLALPVRSFYGTFACLASPYTLGLFKSLLQRSGAGADLPSLPIASFTGSGIYKALLTKDSLLVQPGGSPDEGGQVPILLEEMDLLAEENNPSANAWAEKISSYFFPRDTEAQDIFSRRFAIADDNALDFCCSTGLPVNARIAIDDSTGTVKEGALWYEETIPPETLFTGALTVDRSYKKDCSFDAAALNDFLIAPGTIYCQIGGKATTGKGFMAIDIQKTGK